MPTKSQSPYATTARSRIDALLDDQKWTSIHMDRLTGFDRINARRKYHRLDKRIEALCRESGERRIP
jgi:hypothetical protein